MQLVILDRNGVINEPPDDATAPAAEWRPIRGSLEAIARLHRAGWRLVIASNQPELASGELTPDSLAQLHETMLRNITKNGGAIDAIFFCPHAPAAGCTCHMPAPGLLHDIARRMRIRLDGIPVIGDSLACIQAAAAVGAQPLLVKTGKGFGTVSQPALDPGVPVFNDLFSTTQFLLGRAGQT